MDIIAEMKMRLPDGYAISVERNAFGEVFYARRGAFEYGVLSSHIEEHSLDAHAADIVKAFERAE